MDLTRAQQDRLIYILRYRLGHGCRIIAKALGMSRSRVDCALHRMAGTTRFRAALERIDIGDTTASVVPANYPQTLPVCPVLSVAPLWTAGGSPLEYVAHTATSRDSQAVSR